METEAPTLPRDASLRMRTLVYVAAFIIPLALNANQIITGSLINCLLFLTATKLARKDQIPAALLPSLGALAHGALFGHQTAFLYFFLPFIWLGNYILMAVCSIFSKKQYAVKVIIAAIAKYLLLYVAALAFFGLRLVPAIILTAMGTLQLMTALGGGVLSYIILSFSKMHDRR